MALQRPIVVDHTQVVGGLSLTDYPFLFAGTYTYLKTTANGGNVLNNTGIDIYFSSDPATRHILAYERVVYNPASGKVEFWIRIPSLSIATNTVIYINYGDSNIVYDMQNPSGTWDSNYQCVYHFGDGTTLSLSDSTIYAHNATNFGAVAGAGDNWGGAATFNGQGDHGNPTGASYIDTGSPLNFNPITLESWGSPTVSLGGQTIAANTDGSNHGYALAMPGGSTVTNAYLNNTPHAFTLGTGVYWLHAAMFTYDNTTLNMYDGDGNANVFSGAAVVSGGLTNSTANLLLGKLPTNATNLYGGGYIDEFRISNIVRTYGYFQTTRNNIWQNTPFYTVGAPGTIPNYTKPQRGNIDYDQIRSVARQGPGSLVQMFGGGATTSGHAAMYDPSGNVVDAGVGVATPVIFAGDLSGSSTTQTVVRLQTRAVSNASPTNGQVLTWVSANNDWEPGAGGGGGGSGTGSVYGGLTAPPTVANWTWVNQGTATGTDFTGAVTIIGPATAGDNMHMLARTLASPPYTVTAALFMNFVSTNYWEAGLVLQQTSANLFLTFGLMYNPTAPSGLGLGIVTRSTPTGGGTAPVKLGASYPSTFNLSGVMWLRITDDNTNRNYYYSQDGRNWGAPVYSASRTSNLTPDKVGFGVNPNNTSGSGYITLVSWVGP